ncbi:phosphotransferase family protein [Actinopolymorpha alba]|uniref:phosphotransferase family protein n=1 Tax=Actinopolymorpha alba TaxID=533267 RepID=UPI00036D29FB|nr:aminoglycoside phosphotransferase family protein [Actinopolymorpha alba]
MFVVESEAGQRFVARVHGGPEARDRLAKETWLHGLLREHDIPVPQILAAAACEGRSGTLMPWVEGVTLEQVLVEGSPGDQTAAWQAFGTTLRHIHDIEMDAAGEIVGDRVVPFSPDWDQWATADLPTDLTIVLGRLDMTVDDRLLDEIAERAGHAISLTGGARLLHNDPLPHNVVLSHTSGSWTCTGWLDWDDARTGDPWWDVMKLDFRPAGLVPPAFYDGYGAAPTELRASTYELLMAVWRARETIETGQRFDWPDSQASIDYLQDRSNLIRLQTLLRHGN